MKYDGIPFDQIKRRQEVHRDTHKMAIVRDAKARGDMARLMDREKAPMPKVDENSEDGRRSPRTLERLTARETEVLGGAFRAVQRPRENLRGIEPEILGQPLAQN